MTSKYLYKFKAQAGPIKNRITQKLLYLLYSVFKRSLSVSFISAPDPVIFSGNYFTMYWDVKGCYKIIINNAIVLPGNTTSVHFDSNHAPGKLKISFYGCRQMIEKQITINIIDADLKKQFALYAHPNQFKAKLAKLSLTRFVVHKLKYINRRVPQIPVLAGIPFPALSACPSFLKIMRITEPTIQIDQFKY